MNERVLFTSPVQPIAGCSPDVYSWNKQTAAISLHMCFLNHPGLSFLGANLPGVRILEYPDWDGFCAALEQPPEILGISFYINETEIALRMAEYARQRGVREVWAGNYGAYSPELAPYFDRVFTGWGENEAALALGVEPRTADDFVHPPMYGSLGTNLMPLMTLHGFLYTSRGCPYTCNFCQTPDFYGKSTTVPLRAIDRVLRTYAERGVVTVNVLDENFGIFPRHTREVLRLFSKYGLRWLPLARTDLMLKNFDAWRAHGLCGAHLGVESLNPSSLTGADKKLDHLKSIRLLRKMSEHNMIVQAFYIIGFEEDTVASVRRDIEELASLDVDIAQVQVVTPYPRTRLRQTIDRQFGVREHNLSLYNSRNLVWEHPHISPEDMRELQRWANQTLFTSSRALRMIAKLALFDCTARPGLSGVARIVRGQLQGRRAGLYAQHRAGIRSTREWGKLGWVAYEEVLQKEELRLPLERSGSGGASPRTEPPAQHKKLPLIQTA